MTEQILARPRRQLLIVLMVTCGVPAGFILLTYESVTGVVVFLACVALVTQIDRVPPRGWEATFRTSPAWGILDWRVRELADAAHWPGAAIVWLRRAYLVAMAVWFAARLAVNS